ncbi:UNVERIFIED_CONTAM: hypothetical protein RMT77_003546 [Armadillidium vulgare]
MSTSESSVKTGKEFNDSKWFEKIHLDILKKNVTYIFLLSSLGRSGSSWIGGLLSSLKDSFYLYEPDYYFVIQQHKDINTNNGIRWISEQISCEFDKDFESFLMVNWRQRHYLKPGQSLRFKCLHSQYRILKTIRIRLETLKILFNPTHFANLKVVYIVRDPRAVLTSRNRLGWRSDAEESCNIIGNDLKWFRQFKKDYPQTFFLLRYESICTDTFGEALNLWHFISNDNQSIIPRKWSRFININSRSSEKKNGSFSIKRKTNEEWMKWRLSVKNFTFLKRIEKFCYNTMQDLGYKFFDTIDQVKNLSYSSIS